MLRDALLAAQAAEEFGVPKTKDFNTGDITMVAEKTNKPFWFQLYVMKDKKFMERLIDRAKAAKCSALVFNT